MSARAVSDCLGGNRSLGIRHGVRRIPLTFEREINMAGHGSKPLRGLESTQQSSIEAGKFGRMFRWLEPAQTWRTPAERVELDKLCGDLAKLMIANEFNDNVDDGGDATPDADILTPEPNDENPTIAAGYTYFGQFIDHDITFDPASSLQQQNDPDALVDFRTPRLDLDCIYGRGPADQPYLYAKPSRCKFILGGDRGVAGMDRPDLHRTDDATALIGDKRNDENKIVSQIQALFLKFHNKVFDDIKAQPDAPGDDLAFAEAQRIVRWTYQWLVLHDYLPKICDPAIVDAIMPKGKKRNPDFAFYHPHGGDAYIPVEFSVAAFRFGHSMVRPSYSLNDIVLTTPTAKFKSAKGKVTPYGRVPIFVRQSSAATDAMNGFGEPLPGKWGIDWNFFFGQPKKIAEGKKQIPQPSYRIDATLVDPLGNLPEFARAGIPSPFESLAFRNLMRGISMGLPSGQRVAEMMNATKVLTDKQLWESKADGDTISAWKEGKALLAANKKWLAGCAPLWYYILKEAEILHRGHHLGEVGSRIVAETLIGLVWSDHYSYLFQKPQWSPKDEGLPGLKNVNDMLTLTKYTG
jgi:Animal haem peroxidase